MTNFAPRTATFAAFALVASAVAAISYSPAAAQEAAPSPQDVSAEVASFTQSVMIEVNTDFAQPTPALEARFAALDDSSAIKPDLSYAQNDQDQEETVTQVAANW
ncbi:hypothetical protein [Parvularcula marina]|uniref:hypothetical protein n=1 Tax=Parvularcula marina TaxID=2292771 RepID=UPI00351851F1